MSRTLRGQLPGAAFHITARTPEPYFERHRLQTKVVEIIVECITTSDAMLLAHSVMPNHLHIVLRQGPRSLGWVLQPVMRRIALLVQRARDREGRVFERPYRSRLCGDADHLRRGIIYTHINPLRAHLCADLCEYPWTSHDTCLAGATEPAPDSSTMHVLQLFAETDGSTLADMYAGYVRYLNWRIEKFRCDEADIPYDVPEPQFPAGDRHFADRFCGVPFLEKRPRADLRDRAMQLLQRIDVNVSLDELRVRNLPRARTAMRRQLVAGLLQYGYRRCDIADFLKISDTLVSAVASAMRYARAI